MISRPSNNLERSQNVLLDRDRPSHLVDEPRELIQRAASASGDNVDHGSGENEIIVTRRQRNQGSQSSSADEQSSSDDESGSDQESAEDSQEEYGSSSANGSPSRIVSPNTAQTASVNTPAERRMADDAPDTGNIL